MQALNSYDTNPPLGLKVLQESGKNTNCFAVWYPATIFTKNRLCGVWLKKHQLPPRKRISKKHISFSYYKETRWYRWCSYRIMHDIHCISKLPVCFRPMLIATSLTSFKHLAVKGSLSLNHRKMCSVPLDALNRLFRYLRENISITYKCT